MKKVLILFLAMTSLPLRADIDNNALAALINAANNICASIPMEGKTSSISAEGELSAEVNRILKSLVAADGSLKGKIDESKWRGIPQENLITAITQSNNCKMDTLKLLLPHVELTSKTAEREKSSPEAKLISWDETAREYRGHLEQDFSFVCHERGKIDDVWGTGTYTDRSSICSAAVHSGLITAKNGGIVTIRIKPDQGMYIGSTQHGVESKQLKRKWPGAFEFTN